MKIRLISPVALLTVALILSPPSFGVCGDAFVLSRPTPAPLPAAADILSDACTAIADEEAELSSANDDSTADEEADGFGESDIMTAERNVKADIDTDIDIDIDMQMLSDCREALPIEQEVALLGAARTKFGYAALPLPSADEEFADEESATTDVADNTVVDDVSVITPDGYSPAHGIDTVTVSLYRHGSGETVSMTLAEYVCGIVAAEMPSYFDFEARCAQATAARTFVLYKMKNGGLAAEHPDVRLCDGHTHCCAYLSLSDLTELWQNADSAEQAWRAASEAVAATADEVILYDGEPICAVWHSRSDVATVSAESVWGYYIPYLTGAPTPEEGGYRYGHGVGLSQYGAEAMAKLGADSAGIIANYYSDTVTVKMSVR